MKKALLILLALLALPCARAEESVLDIMSGPVFSALDEMGRSGPAMAILSADTLDPGNREDISAYIPAGFDQAHYGDDYVFQRCHLIGAQLAPETDVPENLFTGTVHLNESLMLPLENSVAKYVRETGGHVIYKVEPRYIGMELIPRWVTVSVWSVETDGMRTSVSFKNAQDGVNIDYLSGGIYVEE